MVFTSWPQEIVDKFKQKLETIDFSNATPSREDVLKFLEIKPCDVKVVIVGQDPYPTAGVANGRAFAVNNDVSVPQSLNNIFKEIVEVKGSVSTDKTLQHWADQGVLLLNRSLTTKIGLSNAHKHIWSDLTLELIKWIDDEIKPTFVLWGNDAISLEKVISHSKIIKDAHPSPLSVRHRNKNTFRLLKEIDW